MGGRSVLRASPTVSSGGRWLQKLLETANIKLCSVVSDVLGVSGRAMLRALVAGERDPMVLAKLAKGSLIPKAAKLAEALRGRFTAHHAFLLGQLLHHVEQLDELISACDARITEPNRGKLNPVAYSRWQDRLTAACTELEPQFAPRPVESRE